MEELERIGAHFGLLLLTIAGPASLAALGYVGIVMRFSHPTSRIRRTLQGVLIGALILFVVAVVGLVLHLKYR